MRSKNNSTRKLTAEEKTKLVRITAGLRMAVTKKETTNTNDNPTNNGIKEVITTLPVLRSSLENKKPNSNGNKIKKPKRATGIKENNK
jgi:hypothetical protein